MSIGDNPISFGDVIGVHDARDTVQTAGGDVQVPPPGPEIFGDVDHNGNPIGNDDGVCEPLEACANPLPITLVFGNAVCSPGPSLPCFFAGANEILPIPIAPFFLPGDENAGFVFFAQNTHSIDPLDPDPLPDFVTYLLDDHCNDPNGQASCPASIFEVPALSSTRWCDPEDGDACTTDTCEFDPGTGLPVCSNTSVCDDPTFSCDDNNVCTADFCDDTNTDGCCANVPIQCPEVPCFNLIGCDPALGCQYESVCDDPDFSCDDQNECTTDTCNDANPPGCCDHGDIPCDPPPVCFTQGPCDPATGCPPPVSVCDDPDFSCDDNNVCTADSCDDTNTDGCCANVPIGCPEVPCFNLIGCDPALGCQYESVCDDPDFSCDDQNECTTDTCNDANPPGCCDHGDIPCDPPPVCFTQGPCDPATGCPPPVSVCDDPTFECPAGSVCDPAAPDCCRPLGGEGCTPGYWKLIERDRGNAHHECNWAHPYDPDDKFKDTCADCGGEVCFIDGFGKLGDFTLIQVLEQPKTVRPPQLRNLGFHTVAALLNAASNDVSFGLTVCEVIQGFNTATAAGEINDAFNDFRTKVSNLNECGAEECEEGDPHCCPLGNCTCSEGGEVCCPGCEGDDADVGCGDGETCGGSNQGDSDCCEAHDGAGCDDNQCQAQVCDNPDFESCCDHTLSDGTEVDGIWDDACAAEASAICCSFLCDEETGPDPECAGQTCDNFTTCNGNTGCVCGSLSNGGGLCMIATTSCGPLDRCFDGICPAGSLCFVDSCCVDPVCVPEAAFCPEGAPRAIGPPPPGTLTIAGVVEGADDDSTAGGSAGTSAASGSACGLFGMVSMFLAIAGLIGLRLTRTRLNGARKQ